MIRTARALRATPWATPAVIVEALAANKAVPTIEASTSDDALKLAADGSAATAAQLASVDAWLKSKGYTRAEAWAARSGEYVATLTA